MFHTFAPTGVTGAKSVVSNCISVIFAIFIMWCSTTAWVCCRININLLSTQSHAVTIREGWVSDQAFQSSREICYLAKFPSMLYPHPHVSCFQSAMSECQDGFCLNYALHYCSNTIEIDCYLFCLHLLNTQCVICVCLYRSEFQDWRPCMASLLQPIPFPDELVLHFIRFVNCIIFVCVIVFLPHGAMLAWYMLWPFVCLSAHPTACLS